MKSETKSAKHYLFFWNIIFQIGSILLLINALLLDPKYTVLKESSTAIPLIDGYFVTIITPIKIPPGSILGFEDSSGIIAYR